MIAKRAADVMTREVLTVQDDLPVAELARVLRDHRVSGAPVLDKRQRLVGVVSASDIVSHELKVGREVVSESEYYARPDVATRDEMRQLGIRIEDYGEALVGEIMTPIVISAPPDASVAELAERMAVNRVHRVIITDGDQIQGVVSALDLVGLIPAATERRTRDEILWATDLGPDAESIGERAAGLALDSGAAVALLHVTPDLGTLMRIYGERADIGPLQTDFEETALAKLHDLAGRILDGVVEYRLIGRTGDPAAIIAQVIEERRPSLVVIGAQRPPELRLKGLGSVAKRILESATVPVLTVPHG